MKPDSLIFDMDGTLWDAVDTYTYCWSLVLKQNGIDKTLTKQDIQGYMGMEVKQIYKELFPNTSIELSEKIYNDIIAKEGELIPVMGGTLYPYVSEGLEKLSSKYKLFMLSNCQKGGIRDFMNYTGTSVYFTDYIEYGTNFKPKSVNIKILAEKNNLKCPVYIGDTDSDSKQTELAGIPFIFASWGFGHTDKYMLKFGNMKSLADYFMKLP